MNKQSFADLGVSKRRVRRARSRGITEPFAIQSLVVADVLAGRDVLAKSPTGSGKTLAFMVPIVDRIEATDRRPAALILAPTRELATQIVDATYRIAHARALKVTAVYGGVGLEKQAREAAKSHIIVATPGRLEDLLAAPRVHARPRQDPRPRRGRPDARHGLPPAPSTGSSRSARAIARRSSSPRRSTARPAASPRPTRATPARHEHAPAVDVVADIEHRFVRVERDARIRRADPRARGRPRAARSSSCAPSAAPTASSSASPPRARSPSRCTATSRSASARRRWRASSAATSTTLVATDVAARGIDVDGISHVINFDPPEDRDGYVHRIGRTGRAGQHRHRDHVRLQRARRRRVEDRRRAGAPQGVRGLGPRHRRRQRQHHGTSRRH